VVWRNTINNYGRFSIGLHWLTALLIVAMIPLGILTEHEVDPAYRLRFLQYHAFLGMTLFGLVFLRLIWRMTNPTPTLPSDMNRFEKAVARTVHMLLLTVMVVLLISGAMTLVLSGAFNAVLGEQFDLPADFHVYPQRIVHGIAAICLIALIVLHAGAAFYHHYVKKDDVMLRMLRSPQSTSKSSTE